MGFLYGLRQKETRTERWARITAPNPAAMLSCSAVLKNRPSDLVIAVSRNDRASAQLPDTSRRGRGEVHQL